MAAIYHTPVQLSPHIKYAGIGIIAAGALLFIWAIYPRHTAPRLPTFHRTGEALAEVPHVIAKPIIRVLPQPIKAHIISQATPTPTPKPVARPTPNPDQEERLAFYKKRLRTGMGDAQMKDRERTQEIPQVIPQTATNTVTWGKGWAQ